MEDLLKTIVDKAQITDLVNRYFAVVDDKGLDINMVQTTFTPDAKIIRPDGSEITGQENILDSHTKSFARFKATHHKMYT